MLIYIQKLSRPDNPIKTPIPPHLSGSSSNPQAMANRKKTIQEESSQDEDNESSSYEVQKILAKRITKKGDQQYKVVWKGYPEDEATWEPRANMNNCSQMIVEFELRMLTERDKQEMVEALLQNDEIQDQVPNVPLNIYETNLHAIGQLSVIQQCKRMGAFLDRAIASLRSLPERCVIEEIVQVSEISESNQPSYYLVKVKEDSRLYKVERDVLLSDERGRMKVIDYYERLIYSK